jgi:ATP-dependent protease HslVU (ClpYQ) peptidase subunit
VVVRTVVVDKVEAGRCVFATVVVDDVDLFKVFSFIGDVAEVERRLAIGFKGDFAAVAVDAVPFNSFDFVASEIVDLGGALIKQLLLVNEYLFI